MPTVEIPLPQPDPDVKLNLGEAVAHVYEGGAYDLQINYSVPPPPPKLSEEEQAWVDNLLQPLHR